MRPSRAWGIDPSCVFAARTSRTCDHLESTAVSRVVARDRLTFAGASPRSGCHLHPSTGDRSLPLPKVLDRPKRRHHQPDRPIGSTDDALEVQGDHDALSRGGPIESLDGGPMAITLERPLEPAARGRWPRTNARVPGTIRTIREATPIAARD